MKLKMWGLFTILLFLHACEFGTAPGGGGTGGEGLTGILVDSKGAGVAGAKVRVYPAPALAKRAAPAAARADSTTTDKDGRFRFVNLPDGRYNLEASITRQDTVYAVFIRGIDFVKSLDLGRDTLRVSGGIRLKVVDEGGAPVAGSRCAIRGSSWTAVSSGSGECVFSGVAPGTYSILISRDGLLLAVTAEVLVESGKESNGGKVTALPASSGGIGADWRLESLQGYAYYLPPDMKLIGEGYGLDTWSAFYSDGAVEISLFTGMVGGTPLPEGAPEYTLDGWTLDSTASGVTGALLATYRIPDSLKSEYPGSNYIAQLFVAYSSPVTFAEPTPFAISLCATSQQLARAKKILRSFHLWKGPGPAPLPPPLPPKLNSPASAAASMPLQVTFKWAYGLRSLTTTAYRLQTATDSLFQNLHSSEMLGTAELGSGLEVIEAERLAGIFRNDTRYYWRVVAEGPGGATPSETRSFTTAPASGEAPMTPALASPAANATGVSVTPMLGWTLMTGAGSVTSYRVHISEDSLFSSLLVQDSLPAPLTQVPVVTWTVKTQLTTARRYFWRVLSVGPGGIAVSQTRSFETTPTGFIASPIYPQQSATGVEWSPALTWSPYYASNAIESHRVQVARDSLFSTLVMDDEFVAVPSNNAHGGPGRLAGPLAPATRYYWRTITYPETVGPTYSRAQSFTTRSPTSDTLPVLPRPQSPTPNGTGVSFGWLHGNYGGNTDYYHLQIAKDSSFRSSVVNDTVAPNAFSDAGITRLTVPAIQGDTILKSGAGYYWRVLGVGRGGVTASAIGSFTVQ